MGLPIWLGEHAHLHGLRHLLDTTLTILQEETGCL
jgi:hypothetical protein